MKIGINARFLREPYTGIGQYTWNMFSELAKVDGENEYVWVVDEELDEERMKELPPNVEVVVIPEIAVGGSGIKRLWWEQIAVPGEFRKRGIELAIFPYPSNPWKKISCPVALVVHDCIPWKHSNYRKGLLSKIKHYFTKRAVKKADWLFTVSDYSKSEIKKYCAAEDKNINVVYCDASGDYSSKIADSVDENVLRNFDLKKNKYLLYVGGYDQRKNVDYLLDEFRSFKEDSGEEIKLVLAGGKVRNSGLYKSFHADISDNDTVRTGFMNNSDLAALYRNALAFISVSRDEGFNIPIIEAAKCNAPVILSDISVHREVAKDSALFIDQNKRGALNQAIKTLLEEDTASVLREKSKKLGAKYSWNNSAKLMKDVLFSEGN